LYEFFYLFVQSIYIQHIVRKYRLILIFVLSVCDKCTSVRKLWDTRSCHQSERDLQNKKFCVSLNYVSVVLVKHRGF